MIKVIYKEEDNYIYSFKEFVCLRVFHQTTENVSEVKMLFIVSYDENERVSFLIKFYSGLDPTTVSTFLENNDFCLGDKVYSMREGQIIFFYTHIPESKLIPYFLSHKFTDLNYFKNSGLKPSDLNCVVNPLKKTETVDQLMAILRDFFYGEGNEGVRSGLFIHIISDGKIDMNVETTSGKKMDLNDPMVNREISHCFYVYVKNKCMIIRGETIGS